MTFTIDTASEPAEKNERAKRPAAKARLDQVSSSIWERETEKGKFYTATFERRYRDKDGNWKTSHSYGLDELLAISKLADLAHTQILRMQKNDGEWPS